MISSHIIKSEFLSLRWLLLDVFNFQWYQLVDFVSWMQQSSLICIVLVYSLLASRRQQYHNWKISKYLLKCWNISEILPLTIVNRQNHIRALSSCHNYTLVGSELGYKVNVREKQMSRFRKKLKLKLIKDTRPICNTMQTRVKTLKKRLMYV